MGRNNKFTLGHIYFEIAVEKSTGRLEIRSGAQERSLIESNRLVSCRCMEGI